MNKLNKKDMVKLIAESTDISQKNVEAVLNAFFSVSAAEVKKGNSVTLTGYVTMSSIETKAREGRNPTTGEKIKIPAGKRFKMKPGKIMKDAVQN